MPTLRVHHIGYLVKKIESAIRAFQNLGYETVQDTIYDEIRKVNICFLEKDGYCIELVSPVSEDSVVSGLLKKFKNSPYHICYETAHFEEDYQRLTNEGFLSIDTPTPAPALQNRRVVFLTNRAMGMIELLECPSA
ncbi:MAG: lactoylglutathione lyase [Lachnospiraceae bacterium]|nr:lactoylglutathione lyase [Lachnospiraceae bacterium]